MSDISLDPIWSMQNEFRRNSAANLAARNDTLARTGTASEPLPGEAGSWVLSGQGNQLVWKPASATSGSNSLSSILSGQGAPIGSANLSAIPNGDLTSWMNSQVQRPQLDQYTGQTAVQMSPETQNMLSQILALSQSPGFQQLLSGKTDQGLFQSGVVNPMQREFRNTTLPGIQDAFSGGAYGGGYWSGARQKASMEGQNQLNEQISGLRYQDYNNAQDRSLQAAGLLPQFSQALSLKEQLAGQNLDRGISVHYQNQGLKDTQYKEDMDFVNSLLGAQNNLNSQMLTARGQDISQASDLRGNALTQQTIDNNLRLGLMGDATSRSNAGLSAMTSLMRPQPTDNSVRTTQMRIDAEAAKAAQDRQDSLALIARADANKTARGLSGNTSQYPSGMGVIQGVSPDYSYQTSPLGARTLREVYDESTNSVVWE